MAGNLLFKPFKSREIARGTETAQPGETPRTVETTRSVETPRYDETLKEEIFRLRRQIEENSSSADALRVQKIDPSRIYPNPMQPRRTFNDEAILRLADSIRQYGVIQPLTVRCTASADADRDKKNPANSPIYELVAGERRLRASKLIGLKEVPCIVIEADSRKSAELAIIENIQRENLNMFEQAAAISSLIEIYDMTQEKIARQLSTSQSYVANKLRLLKLTSAEREIILKANLTERHARATLRLPSSELRLEALDYIISRELNVSRTEEYIEELLTPKIHDDDAGTQTQETDKNTKGKTEPEIRKKFIIKDIRIFYNTIDHAVDTVKRAGIDIQSRKTEKEDTMELYIQIPKRQAVR